MIRLENIYKSFRNGRDQVLRGVSLEFEEGKLTYILGPSGTGKSVLIKHVLGLLKPDQGDVFVAGKNISKLKGRELASHRLAFGMLFQNAALFDDKTVFENVAFPLREHTTLEEKEIEFRVKKSLALLGMPSGFDKFPDELSGGMRKRVGLARAIIREPRILLYDEPTTGLDPITALSIDNEIIKLRDLEDVSSILVTHQLRDAFYVAQHHATSDGGAVAILPAERGRCTDTEFLMLKDGEVLFEGSARELRASTDPYIHSFLS